jgi:hypothetical protein
MILEYIEHQGWHVHVADGVKVFIKDLDTVSTEIDLYYRARSAEHAFEQGVKHAVLSKH